MDKYNLSKLVKISVRDFTKSILYKWLPGEKKTFWYDGREEGFYEAYGGYIGKELPKGHVFKDGDVYMKPRVLLIYVDKISKLYYFGTLKEAEEFAEEIEKMSECKWIK